MLDEVAGPLAPTVSVRPLIRPESIGGSEVVRDYLQELPQALAFFRGSPFRLDSYRAKLDEVARRFDRDDRAATARALRPTSPAARQRLERFVDEGGAVVTTGQQAGFLTGPLYTVYKALSAAALARHLEQSLGVLVLPVFWIASDDHDWLEANHAVVLDAHNRARRFALESEDERALPMSDRRLEGELEPLLEEVAQTVGGNESTADWVRRILDPYRRSDATVGEAFGAAMGALLEPFDFCLADAADPALKALSRPVVRAALVDAAEHERGLRERSERLEALGYRGQVAVQERATNVFVHEADGTRSRLYRRGEGFGVRGQRERLDAEALVGRLEDEPARFSPNVFLRPVVESWVFPTLAYVGGPGELAYFAQAGVLFEAYGMTPPVAVPRFSGLIVEPKVERLLEGLGLTVSDTRRSREKLVEALARREIPDEVGRSLTEMREELARDFERLLDDAARLDPTLAGPIGASRNRTLAEAGRVERKVLRAIKRGDRIALGQLDRVLDSLRPGGAPQDRVLNVLPFLARYGQHFLREAMRAIEAGWRLPEDPETEGR